MIYLDRRRHTTLRFLWMDLGEFWHRVLRPRLGL